MNNVPTAVPLDQKHFAERWNARPDSTEKAYGLQQYPTDELHWPGLLHGRILRSAWPHAHILHIDLSQARSLPGVHAVVCAEDIPGTNSYGIIFRDQPVFCTDRVRFLGDAIAAVAADSPEIAAHALTLIKVVYEPLPNIGDSQQALTSAAPRLHPDGNLLDSSRLGHGDIDAGFAQCSYIVDSRYSTPRQMHVFMETEGGVAIPEQDGSLTFRVGCQSGHRDRDQLADILGLPQHKVRVIGLSTGGGFGGKDELTMQPAAGLLALKTGRPVRIHYDRQESTRAGIKRHPIQMFARTGCDAEGTAGLRRGVCGITSNLLRSCAQLIDCRCHAIGSRRLLIRTRHIRVGGIKYSQRHIIQLTTGLSDLTDRFVNTLYKLIESHSQTAKLVAAMNRQPLGQIAFPFSNIIQRVTK